MQEKKPRLIREEDFYDFLNSFMTMQIVLEIKPRTTADTLVNFVYEERSSQYNHAVTRSSYTIG